MLWLIIGLILGVVFYHVVAGTRAGKYRVRWYQWLLGVAAAGLYLLTIENYLGLHDELEPAMANLMLVLMGLPALVLTALIWLIPRVMRPSAEAAGRKGRKAEAEPV